MSILCEWSSRREEASWEDGLEASWWPQRARSSRSDLSPPRPRGLGWQPRRAPCQRRSERRGFLPAIAARATVRSGRRAPRRPCLRINARTNHVMPRRSDCPIPVSELLPARREQVDLHRLQAATCSPYVYRARSSAARPGWSRDARASLREHHLVPATSRCRTHRTMTYSRVDPQTVHVLARIHKLSSSLPAGWRSSSACTLELRLALRPRRHHRQISTKTNQITDASASRAKSTGSIIRRLPRRWLLPMFAASASSVATPAASTGSKPPNRSERSYFECLYGRSASGPCQAFAVGHGGRLFLRVGNGKVAELHTSTGDVLRTFPAGGGGRRDRRRLRLALGHRTPASTTALADPAALLRSSRRGSRGYQLLLTILAP